MRYFWSILEVPENPKYEGIAAHAFDPKTDKLYTYSQELKTWHQDPTEPNESLEEITREELYEILPLTARMDRRSTHQREISNAQRSQTRRSGEVLTSAEVGLLAKPLNQRPLTMPRLKELIETRSQHKRWTALFLYEQDGPARRKAISSLRHHAALTTSSKGDPLDVQHRRKRFVIDGIQREYTAVEIKYIRHT